MSTGYVIFAHGSSVESANEAVRVVAADVARQGQMENVVAAFLEGGRPLLPEAIEQLASEGMKKVVVIPYFLTLGVHLKRDLPALTGAAQQAHPGLEITVTPPLDGHPAMAAALVDRAKGAA